MTNIVVRPTSPDDLDTIGAIYAHHVESGVATFELIPPVREEWNRRLATARERELPFLTADIDGEIAGYAYCAPWKLRPTYRHTVENSIYLAPQSAGRGLGTLLLQGLLVSS